jgi:DNA-binding NarL/FixJ family response regulator
MQLVHNSVQSANVLIVDDDDLARLALARLLEQSGIDVVCASTPAAARDARECTVLVSELRLTGQTAEEGLALLSELRRQRPKSRLVIFSSFLGAHEAGLPAPLSAAVPKSTPLRDVAAMIRSLLAEAMSWTGMETDSL